MMERTELEEKERQIRVLKRTVEVHEKTIIQLKKDKYEALDNMYDAQNELSKLRKKSENEYAINNQELDYEAFEEQPLIVQVQYDKIRTAFDRKKRQHQAIKKCLEHYNFRIDEKRLSLTQMIKIGEQLQSKEL